MLFLYILPSDPPEGAGHWRCRTQELALEGRQRQCPGRARSNHGLTASQHKTAQDSPTAFLGTMRPDRMGLEGALRATETSCVPLQEAPAYTKPMAKHLAFVGFHSRKGPCLPSFPECRHSILQTGYRSFVQFIAQCMHQL